MVNPSGMELPPYYKYPPKEVRLACRQILLEVSKAFKVPPGHVTSHIKTLEVQAARALVMRLMLIIGLRRVDLAVAFNRDLRRVRSSVVGMTVVPAWALAGVVRAFGESAVPAANPRQLAMLHSLSGAS
ncbi:MAG: hypothetical protein WCO57_06915 [Verrucomicrobiota bacterium]